MEVLTGWVGEAVTSVWRCWRSGGTPVPNWVWPTSDGYWTSTASFLISTYWWVVYNIIVILPVVIPLCHAILCYWAILYWEMYANLVLGYHTVWSYWWRSLAEQYLVSFSQSWSLWGIRVGTGGPGGLCHNLGGGSGPPPKKITRLLIWGKHIQSNRQ